MAVTLYTKSHTDHKTIGWTTELRTIFGCTEGTNVFIVPGVQTDKIASKRR